jgi:hypothetical protein
MKQVAYDTDLKALDDDFQKRAVDLLKKLPGNPRSITPDDKRSVVLQAYEQMVNAWPRQTYKQYELDPIAVIQTRGERRLRPVSSYFTLASGASRYVSRLLVVNPTRQYLPYCSESKPPP